MKRLITAVTVLCILGAGGCVPDTKNHPVPPGKYYGDSRDEWIEVGPTSFYFHIKYREVESMADRYIDRRYEYWVDDGDGIFFSMSSNEFAYLEFFINPWRWRDGRIASEDDETGRTAWFTKSGE